MNLNKYKKAIRSHLPCADCGSSDALSEYEDGTYCFSCGKARKHTDTDGQLKSEDKDSDSQILTDRDVTEISSPDLEFKDCERGYTKEIVSLYGSGYDSTGRRWFPYYIDNRLVKYKTKSPQKKITWIGNSDIECNSLYGTHTASVPWTCILTEGEEDAEAAYYLTDGKFSCLSIPHGAASVEKILKLHLQYLEQFDKVYIAFDMDKPGRAAADKALQILQKGKAYDLKLPSPYKDICELLSDWISKKTLSKIREEFKKIIYTAQPIQPVGLKNSQQCVTDAVEWLYDINKSKGFSTGIEGLDRLIGGFRGGEILTVAAASGIGKSAFVRQLVYNQLEAKTKCLFLPLEDTVSPSLIKLTEMRLETDLIKTDDKPDRELVEKTMREFADYLVLPDISVSFDPQTVLDLIEYGVRGQGAQLVLIDHLTLITEGCSGSTREVTEKLGNKLREVSNKLSIPIVVVVHLSRSQKEQDALPELDKLKHSSTLEQISNCVLGLARVRDTNIMRVATLKANRLWGVYGEFNLEYSHVTKRMDEVCIEKKEEDEQEQNKKKLW